MHSTLLLIMSRIGEVIEGMDVIKAVEKVGSSSGKPSVEVVVTKSGTVEEA